MDNDTCPKCGSGHVRIGAFVLECFGCGWHYLNKHPCRVCGGPSRSAGGLLGPDVNVQLYGCKEHPVTTKEWQNAIRGQPFFQGVR